VSTQVNSALINNICLYIFTVAISPSKISKTSYLFNIFIKQIGSKWNDLGVALQIITEDRRSFSDDRFYCGKMLQIWLDQQTDPIKIILENFKDAMKAISYSVDLSYLLSYFDIKV